MRSSSSEIIIRLNKKVILIGVMLTLFGGVASASSINGEYKGNPIIKIKSNGKDIAISSEEVPAFIFENSTVVPISVLRNLGANVTWDASTYSVDISTTDSIVKQLFDEKIVTSGEKRFFTYNNPYLMLKSEIDFLTGDNSKVLDKLLRVTSSTDAESVKVTFMNNPRKAESVILFDTSDAQLYSKGDISLEQMVDKINVQVNYFPVKNIKASISKATTESENPKPSPTLSPNATLPNTPAPTVTPNPTTPPVTVIKTEFPELYSSDGKVYLGKLTTNEFDTDSIYNEFGSFGSEFSQTSIWNEFSTYGSELSSKSAFNDLAPSPPIIVFKGKIIGYLTTNTVKTNAIAPNALKSWLIDNGY